MSNIEPEHYKKWGIEPLEFIISNNFNFIEGNIIKYVARYKYKNWLEDLEKSKFYLDTLIYNYKENESKINK